MEDSNAEVLVWADLFIDSPDLTPDYIGQCLGLKPTRVHIKGDTIVEGSQPVRASKHSFILNVCLETIEKSSRESGEILKTAIEELIMKIEPVQGQIAALRPKISIQLFCTYNSKMHKPKWLLLPNDLLKRLASLDVSIQILWNLMEGESSAIYDSEGYDSK